MRLSKYVQRLFFISVFILFFLISNIIYIESYVIKSSDDSLCIGSITVFDSVIVTDLGNLGKTSLDILSTNISNYEKIYEKKDNYLLVVYRDLPAKKELFVVSSNPSPVSLTVVREITDSIKVELLSNKDSALKRYELILADKVISSGCKISVDVPISEVKAALTDITSRNYVVSYSGNEVLSKSSLENMQLVADMSADFAERNSITPIKSFVNLMLAVAFQESRFKQTSNTQATAGTSVGIMQIYTPNVQEACEMSLQDVTDDKIKNIECGLKLMKSKYDDFHNGLSRESISKFCKDSVIATKYASYSGWDAALRGYNGWGCGKYADTKYVETINDYLKSFTIDVSSATISNSDSTDNSNNNNNFLFDLPSIETVGKFGWPTSEFIVSSCFGARTCTGACSKDHGAIDIPIPKGTPVIAEFRKFYISLF